MMTRQRVQYLSSGTFMNAASPSTARRNVFKFRLYTADGTRNSVHALANLTTLCRLYLPDRHEIEVIDVFRDPERARTDGIRMTPTLVKWWPAPTCKIAGALSRTRSVLSALGLEVTAA